MVNSSTVTMDSLSTGHALSSLSRERLLGLYHPRFPFFFRCLVPLLCHLCHDAQVIRLFTEPIR